jgi:hypothetical protein
VGIDDKTLCQQILIAARIQHFLIGNEGVEIRPDLMLRNYGILLCNLDVRDVSTTGLDSLLSEAHRRSENGSKIFQGFLAIIDKLANHQLGKAAVLVNGIQVIRRAVRSELDIVDTPILPESDVSAWLSRPEPKKMTAQLTGKNL